MNNNILISGGTGFLGSNIIYSLRNKYNFTNIGRGTNKYCNNLYWNLYTPITNTMKNNIDVIIHCASIVGNNELDRDKYIDINVKSTLNLLEYGKSKNIKKFIYISTGGVYGYGDNKFKETDECNPKDLYCLTKFFSEKLCNLYSDNFEVVILRLFFPYGNFQSERLISNLVKNVIEKNEIVLNNDGKPIINPINIIDVVNIINRIIEMDCNGIFNICGNEYFSIQDLCNLIANMLNIHRVNYVFSGKSTQNLMGDNSKVLKLCNYKNSVDLERGLKEYILSIDSCNGGKY